MNNKTLFAVSTLVIALTGCNDKTAEYQVPATQAESPASPETDAPESPHSAVNLSEFKDALSSLGKTELCALDAVNGESPSESSFKAEANSPVVLEGWTATTSLTNPGAVAVVISTAGKAFMISGRAGIARDDVAKAYSAEALSNSGFRLELPSLDVPAGEYAVAVLHEEAGAQVSCASQFSLIVQ